MDPGRLTEPPESCARETRGEFPSTDVDAFEGEPPLDVDAGTRTYLIARLGDDTRVIDLIDGADVTIGRDPTSTVVVDNSRVSRHHARLWRRGESVGVEDLASRNGTKVNGAVLRMAARSLLGGDTVEVGALQLVLAAASPGPTSAPQLEAEGAVVADHAMVEVFRIARRLAATPTTVLILGETGVGKEVVAEQIHRWSERARGPFVRLNCASLPETLLESEIFGYERGAFTGADRRKVGYLEAANGGTLLLDEIGELSPTMQAKLLRALENRSVPRVGGTQEVAVDARFICATHRDLRADVAAGRFRQDLYYRVSGFTLKIPPLRERPTEVTLLADLFAREFARRLGSGAPRLGRDVTAALLRHAWPGNVRELRNAIEHAVILSEGAPIGAKHLPETVLEAQSDPSAGSLAASGAIRNQLADLEKRRIEEALQTEGGNQTRAAKSLGMSRRNLVYKMGKYGIKS